MGSSESGCCGYSNKKTLDSNTVAFDRKRRHIKTHSKSVERREQLQSTPLIPYSSKVRYFHFNPEELTVLWHDDSNTLDSNTLDSRINPIAEKIDSFSLKQSINYTCNLLLFDFIRNCDLDDCIPSEIQYVCLNFLIGDFPSKIHDDTVSGFSDKGINEIFQFIFSILFPHPLIMGNEETDASKLSLITLVSLIFSLIQKKRENEPLPPSNILKQDAFYYESCYLSLLLSLTDLTYFHDKLTIKAMDPDWYNGILIGCCDTSCTHIDRDAGYNIIPQYIDNPTYSRIGIQLLYYLLTENECYMPQYELYEFQPCNYYEIYLKTFKEEYHGHKEIIWFVEQFDIDPMNVVPYRKLVACSVGNVAVSDFGSNIQILHLLNQQISQNDILIWCWLFKEIKFITLDVHSIDGNTRHELQSIMDQTTKIMTKLKHETIKTLCIDILHLLSKTNLIPQI